MAPNGFSVNELFGIAYQTRLHCANPRALLDAVVEHQPRGSEHTTQSDRVRRAIADVSARLRSSHPRTLSESALIHAVLNDLQRLDDAVIAIGDSAMDIASVERLADSARVFCDLLCSAGFDVAPPPIFVVDTLPSPYSSMAWAALHADIDDYGKHGITPGVYFVKSAMRPYQTESLLAHELIHHAIRGFTRSGISADVEEGFAELFGGLWCTSRVLGERVAQALFVYGKLAVGANDYWLSYAEYCARLYMCGLRVGFTTLIDRAVESPDHLVELQLSAVPAQPQSNLEEQLTREISSVLSPVLEETVLRWSVSPCLWYVARAALPGTSVQDIARSLNCSSDEVSQSLNELQETLGIVTIKHGQVVESLAATLQVWDTRGTWPKMRYVLSSSDQAALQTLTKAGQLTQ